MDLKQVTIAGILATLLFYAIVLACFAEIPDEVGVRCIIGEASNQGYAGLEACADALQNRDTIKGVYGCNAKHIDQEPAWVWDMAERAWEAAKYENPTNGADHWENIKAFGEPSWAKSMTKTICVKDQCFYRSN